MYRTISETLDIIKSLDKNTSITLYYLRCLCKSGQIQVLNAGGKILINLKSLGEFLQLDLTKNIDSKEIVKWMF